ncbi:phage holin family protein [Brevibacillus sp. SYSU BS000544]|uniref:phage holin family protein n=1 Tax=Brevibacillus sp. SYSU BS000544 TaxID=3416443 RepID=UPI003CE586B4
MREYGLQIYTATFATAVTYFMGEMTPLLGVLMWLVAIDYSTGVFAAYIEKNLSSRVSFMGLARKILIFVLVAVAHKLDIALNSPGFLRNLTIYFYIANEGLSLLENIARAGVPIPTPLKSALVQLKKRSDGNRNIDTEEHKEEGK